VAGSKLANSVRLIIVYRAVDDDEYGRLTRFFSFWSLIDVF
jgi:hypothetical protein